MKTAMWDLINEIVEHLTYDDDLTEDTRSCLEKIRIKCISKLEKEQIQIVEAWYDGYNNSSPMIDEENSGDTYYNRIFKNDAND
jgi:hypothetical protein